MIVINEPKIESYYDNSEIEIINTLNYLVENSIKIPNHSLNKKELEILQKREKELINNPNLSIEWEKIKNKYL
jgi:hypothetical protein